MALLNIYDHAVIIPSESHLKGIGSVNISERVAGHPSVLLGSGSIVPLVIDPAHVELMKLLSHIVVDQMQVVA